MLRLIEKALELLEKIFFFLWTRIFLILDDLSNLQYLFSLLIVNLKSSGSCPYDSVTYKAV